MQPRSIGSSLEVYGVWRPSMCGQVLLYPVQSCHQETPPASIEAPKTFEMKTVGSPTLHGRVQRLWGAFLFVDAFTADPVELPVAVHWRKGSPGSLLTTLNSCSPCYQLFALLLVPPSFTTPPRVCLNIRCFSLLQL